MHEYVYFGYGHSDEWDCYDFMASDVSVKRDRIVISGTCLDDHVRTTYDLLFDNEDIDVWYDSGYDEEEDTVEREFTITLSPGRVSVNIDKLKFTEETTADSDW